ncbi:hypothetical protein DV737_g2838, partial [Chaetothyriales sp. CBS 132003]
MGLTVDLTANTFLTDSTSPYSKRRKFTPPTFPVVIPSTENGNFEDHTFSSPILPQLSGQSPSQAEIEESLLQVGMRIRKSVNEGYKTSQKLFTPRPFANNLMRLSPETQRALLAGNEEPTTEPEPFSAGGLHKVGNLRIQPLATATFCGVNLSMMSWPCEDYTSVEEQQQQLWSYTTSHKRSHETDSDSEDSQDWQPQTPTLAPDDGKAMGMDCFNIDIDNMSDISPLTHPLGMLHHHGRKMAKPRSRYRETQMYGVDAHPVPPTGAVNAFASVQMLARAEQSATSTAAAPPQTFGFENRADMSCGVEANLMDFGDAPFLQRLEDVDMDCS